MDKNYRESDVSMLRMKTLFACVFVFFAMQSVSAQPLAEQFIQNGYREMCNQEHGSVAFDALYNYFDEFIKFLDTHPVWLHKLSRAKQLFIRSTEKNYYSTDYFGLYDESKKTGRGPIAFYYSIHFHEYICFCYPEIKNISEIINFFQACYDIEYPYGTVFEQAAIELGVASIFAHSNGVIPILLKVVKYFPSYIARRPHYDGTVFSLFLDSTNNQSLLLAPYTLSLSCSDFNTPLRNFYRLEDQSSMLLIPGVLLAEFGIDPTPHIVVSSDETRYATIAFAMRPDYVQKNHAFSQLPLFKN